MTNHIHLIVKAKDGFELVGILRDFKKFTSRQLIKPLKSIQVKAERNGCYPNSDMLELITAIMTNISFGNKTTNPLNYGQQVLFSKNLIIST